jgi:hypothetical protein
MIWFFGGAQTFQTTRLMLVEIAPKNCTLYAEAVEYWSCTYHRWTQRCQNRGSRSSSRSCRPFHSNRFCSSLSLCTSSCSRKPNKWGRGEGFPFVSFHQAREHPKKGCFVHLQLWFMWRHRRGPRLCRCMDSWIPHKLCPRLSILATRSQSKQCRKFIHNEDPKIS